LGLAVLANSRPFEGLVISLPVGIVWLAGAFAKNASSRGGARGQVAVPLLLVLGLTGAGMAYYNQRLTGHPLRLPYQHNADTYSFIPVFLWQPLQPEPSYRHEAIREYQVRWAKEQYLAKRTPAGYARDLADRFNQFTSFFLSVPLLVPLVALPWIVRRPWLRFAFLTCATLLAALSVTTWFQPHYAAPIVAPLF